MWAARRHPTPIPVPSPGARTARGQPRREAPGSRHPATASRSAGSADDSARVFSAPVPGGVNDIAWSADGARVAAAGGSGSVPRLYTRTGGCCRPDRALGRRLSSRLDRTRRRASSVGNRRVGARVGRDGRRRAASCRATRRRSRGGVTFDDRGRVTLVEADGAAGTLDSGQPGRRAACCPRSPGGPSTCTRPQRPEDLIAVGLQERRVIVRDTAGHELASASFPEELAGRASRWIRADGGWPSRSPTAPSGSCIDLTPGAKPQIVGAARQRRAVHRGLQPGRRDHRQRRPGRRRSRCGADPAATGRSATTTAR